MVVCAEGVIWHGGQEGLSVAGYKLAKSSNASDRTTPCKGVKFADEIRNAAVVSCNSCGTGVLWGHIWRTDLALGDGPKARLVHPMPVLTGLVQG